MSNFYNTSNQGPSDSGGGFYSSGGGYAGQQFHQSSMQQQQQQQQQQQPSFSNVQQWHQSSSSQYGNNSATSGFSQQQQPAQQTNSNQQQSQQTPNFWNPATAAAVTGLVAQGITGGMSGEKVLDIASKAGMNAWQSGGASMIPGFNSTMQTLRTYFAVDNRYVKRKMQKVLFPFLSKQWRRSQMEGPNLVNYALPNSDENAPDLYLPLMSVITYCLLAALLYGTAGEFNPEVIADVTTKCLATQILEVLIIRFGLYMMQAPVQLLDLFAYTGYKYVGLTCNIVVGMGLSQLGYGTSGFYGTFLWTASAMSFFMLKTMANNIPIQTAAGGPKREIMILAFAGSQIASMWFVSQTKYL